MAGSRLKRALRLQGGLVLVIGSMPARVSCFCVGRDAALSPYAVRVRRHDPGSVPDGSGI